MLGVRSLWAADLARSPLFSTASRPAPAQAFSGMSAHCSAPTRPVFCPLLSVFSPSLTCSDYILLVCIVSGDNAWFSRLLFLQLVSTTWKLNIVLLCPCRNRLEALSNVDHCPSVCSMPDTKSRMEGHRKLKIGRREARVMGHLWPHLQIKRSRCLGQLMLRQQIGHIIEMVLCIIQTSYTDEIRPASTTCACLKGQGYNVSSSLWRMFAHNLTSCRFFHRLPPGQ